MTQDHAGEGGIDCDDSSFVVCEECHGLGEIYDGVKCPECEGHGSVEVPTEPIELEDLDEH